MNNRIRPAFCLHRAVIADSLKAINSHLWLLLGVKFHRGTVTIALK